VEDGAADEVDVRRNAIEGLARGGG